MGLTVGILHVQLSFLIQRPRISSNRRHKYISVILASDSCFRFICQYNVNLRPITSGHAALYDDNGQSENENKIRKKENEDDAETKGMTS
jgi:hypothetical protein